MPMPPNFTNGLWSLSRLWWSASPMSPSWILFLRGAAASISASRVSSDFATRHDMATSWVSAHPTPSVFVRRSDHRDPRQIHLVLRDGSATASQPREHGGHLAAVPLVRRAVLLGQRGLLVA